MQNEEAEGVAERDPIVIYTTDGEEFTFENAAGIGTGSALLSVVNADGQAMAMFNLNYIRHVQVPSNNYEGSRLPAVEERPADDPASRLLVPAHYGQK